MGLTQPMARVIEGIVGGKDDIQVGVQALSQSLIKVACGFLTLYLLRCIARKWERPVSFNCSTVSSLQRSHLSSLAVLDEPSIALPGSTVIQCYAPASGKLLGRVNPVTPEGIDRAVKKAAEAHKIWAKKSWYSRRKVFRALLQHILSNQDAIAHAACLDSGKVRVDASFGDILATCEKISWTIKHGEKALRTETRPGNLLMCYKRNEVWYEPLGVVAALVSWNYPFHNVIHPIVSALATGNGILLKPSERTCISTQYFVSIVQQAITVCFPEQHGLSNLIQCVPCWPSTASYLTTHPSISHVTFIGSRSVAQYVAASAAKSLTALTLELGGKDPAIVLANAPKSDLPRIASILMRGVFQAAGQNCIGIERIIIQPPHLKSLLEMLEPRVSAIRVGDALDPETTDEVDMGACISNERFGELESLIDEAVKQGAVLHVGGHRYNHPCHPQGHYFLPTLLSNIGPHMRIARTELFAPVMLVFSSEYTHSVESVLELANGTPYALGASVFGKHGSEELQRVTKGVNAGMVSVNDFASYYLCSLPFGGAQSSVDNGGSGYGRFGGPEGLRALCNVKSVNRDRWWGVVKTAIPSRLDYRKDGQQASDLNKGVELEETKWRFASGIVDLGFGVGFVDRIQGLWHVILNG